MASKATNQVPVSKTIKCPKCGVRTFHTLIDPVSRTYRCVKCGTCHALR